ncbi:MAG: hypothetical protein F6K40_38795 [Okeania sp. SIO3I5]|uniref:hypothetical protein n=1 Tax=Okeania sp. SIO3I5 TaxID=2607805 RepID=UPI0013B787AB|nr:hypothetical protein [Okeania sp. SIO3I5]NEQ41812.1 hypothetical protein [Okeania sp. SIO3I5]
MKQKILATNLKWGSFKRNNSQLLFYLNSILYIFLIYRILLRVREMISLTTRRSLLPVNKSDRL